MKRIYPPIVVISLILCALLVWFAPDILALVPSRYIAAYMPQFVQELAAGSPAELLPTPVATVNTAALLPALTPTRQAPPTLTPTLPAPPIQITSEATATPTAELPTFTPSPTPSPTSTPWPYQPAARLVNVTHHFQTWNNCGPATLAMTLSYFGVYQRQTDTAAFLKPDPEDRNVTPAEMVAYVQQFTDLEAVTRVNGDIDTLKRLLSNNIPVMIETGIDPPGEFSWMEWYGHYLLVVAYDDRQQTFWVYDSWLGTTNEVQMVTDENGEVIAQGSQTGDGRTLAYATFDSYWRQFNRTYVAVYRPEQAPLVQGILGDQLQDDLMWQHSLERVSAELQAEPDNAFLWFNLGSVYTGQQNYDLAAQAFDQARQIGLPWRMLWYQFAPYEAYYHTGRYDDVINLATLTLDRRSYFEEAFYYRGLAYQALGNITLAQADWNEAVKFNPNYQLPQDALANLNN